MDAVTLAAMIDQTLLSPTCTRAEGVAWLERNRDAGFASLCVSPWLVPDTAAALAGRPTRVCSVVGFPAGFALTETKVAEARELVARGAVEIDMVINVGALLGGDVGYVRDEITAVVAVVRAGTGGAGLTKVILETGLLDAECIEAASRLAVEAGAHFVKTSTGFGPRGASVQDVRIMRAAVGPDVGVKASGGIRDLDFALELIEAGATRIGTSSGLELLRALAER